MSSGYTKHSGGTHRFGGRAPETLWEPSPAMAQKVPALVLVLAYDSWLSPQTQDTTDMDSYSSSLAWLGIASFSWRFVQGYLRASRPERDHGLALPTQEGAPIRASRFSQLPNVTLLRRSGGFATA